MEVYWTAEDNHSKIEQEYLKILGEGEDNDGTFIFDYGVSAD